MVGRNGCLAIDVGSWANEPAVSHLKPRVVPATLDTVVGGVSPTNGLIGLGNPYGVLPIGPGRRQLRVESKTN